MNIKNCPFCGSEDGEEGKVTSGGDKSTHHFVSCECGASVIGRTRLEAIQRWNRRDSGNTIAEEIKRRLNAKFEKTERKRGEPDESVPSIVLSARMFAYSQAIEVVNDVSRRYID